MNENPFIINPDFHSARDFPKFIWFIFSLSISIADLITSDFVLQLRIIFYTLQIIIEIYDF